MLGFRERPDVDLDKNDGRYGGASWLKAGWYSVIVLDFEPYSLGPGMAGIKRKLVRQCGPQHI